MHRHLLTKAWEKGDTDVHPLRVRIRHLRQKNRGKALTGQPDPDRTGGLSIRPRKGLTDLT